MENFFSHCVGPPTSPPPPVTPRVEPKKGGFLEKLEEILTGQEVIRDDISCVAHSQATIQRELAELRALHDRHPSKYGASGRNGSQRKPSSLQVACSGSTGNGTLELAKNSIVSASVAGESLECGEKQYDVQHKEGKESQEFRVSLQSATSEAEDKHRSSLMDTMSPSSSQHRPSSVMMGSSWYVGAWRDPSGCFYGGQIIDIKECSWDPGFHDTPASSRSIYSVEWDADGAIDLVDSNESGVKRRFRISEHEGSAKEELGVHVHYRSMQGFEVEWVLLPATSNVETSHVLPDDHLQKIKMACVLNSADVTHDPLKNRGFAQRIVKSSKFESLSLVVVVVNAIWIAVDTDWNDAEILAMADWQFQVMENMFCVFFVTEWLLRFSASSRCGSLLKDLWFMFDTFLVGLMVFETWIMTIIVMSISGSESPITSVAILRMFRLMRLTRLNRMVRVLRFVPELLFMVKGAFKASRSVMVTLGMLIFVVYIFGIAFKQLSEGYKFGERFFPSVGAAIYTLLMDATLLDSTGIVMSAILQESIMCTLMFAMVILLAAYTVMNMLIGVLCEVVSNVSAEERDKMDIAFVRDKIFEILALRGLEKRRTISKLEFLQLLETQEAIRVLKEVGVNPSSLIDFADFFFQSDRIGKSFEKKIEYEEFISAVMKLRTGAQASVEDVMYLKKFVRDENMSLYKRVEDIHAQVGRINLELDHSPGQ